MSLPSNRRQFLRIPIPFKVMVVVPDRIIASPRVINISMGGILIDGRDRLPVGTECGVAILLEDGETGKRIVARGTVVRSDEEGMAITFSRIPSANSLQALRTLIETIAPEAGRPLHVDPS